MMRSTAHRIALSLLFSTCLLGCAARHGNPSFPVTADEANRDLKRMAQSPQRLERPLVIVGGFMDVGVVPWSLKQRIATLTGDDRILAIGIGNCLSLDACHRKIVDAVNRNFPPAESVVSTTSRMIHPHTVEVDVIGCSLGGLAARYASLAENNPAECRLRIVRLFTISSPMRGSMLAEKMPPLHPIQKELRRGSAAIARIDAIPADYPIVSYVRLGDKTIGPDNAAPPGQVAWWVDTPPLEDPHNGAFSDPRILADIALRLRGERSFTVEPPSPIKK